MSLQAFLTKSWGHAEYILCVFSILAFLYGKDIKRTAFKIHEVCRDVPFPSQRPSTTDSFRRRYLTFPSGVADDNSPDRSRGSSVSVEAQRSNLTGRI